MACSLAVWFSFFVIAEWKLFCISCLCHPQQHEACGVAAERHCLVCADSLPGMNYWQKLLWFLHPLTKPVIEHHYSKADCSISLKKKYLFSLKRQSDNERHKQGSSICLLTPPNGCDSQQWARPKPGIPFRDPNIWGHFLLS